MMVDAAAYLRENTSEKQDLIPLDIGSMMPELEIGDDNHEQKKLGTQQKNDSLDGAAGGADQDGVGESQVVCLPFSSSDRLLTQPPLYIGANLTDQELMLCNGVVRGYSLKLNRWAKFQVDNVREVSWNEVAFSGLMLPDGYKDLLLSFVEEPDQLGFDDIIEGKGLGTIVLLAGNPGTGKTLTAEAVADHVRRPLYSLNVGELGQRASSVENKLQSVLELTEKWNAILLFDECDVFMQKRTTENLKHNEIVAVALRYVLLCSIYLGARCTDVSQQNPRILPWHPLHDLQPLPDDRPRLREPHPSYAPLSRPRSLIQGANLATAVSPRRAQHDTDRGRL